jgi:CheY-like chemotaxis protein
VITACDGSEAIQVFQQQSPPPTCVVMDLTMPHMDGESAFRELRRIKPDLKVIICSGYNEQEVTERFVGKGLTGFVAKPYQFGELRDVLRGALEHGE